MTCKDCKREPCACELIARAECSEARVTEVVAEAYRVRRLWQAAAACILHNQKAITPRGEDERRMIEIAADADLGPFWAGTTDGWI